MTQDRRITDKLPGQPLDWSDAASPASNKAAADLTSLPIAYYVKLDNDGSAEFNTVDEFSCARTGGEALVKFSDVRAYVASAARKEHAIGEVVRGNARLGLGWHVQGYKPWNEIGEGTKLYTRAAPAAQPDRNAIIEECAQRVESCLAHLTPVEIIGAERHEQSCNVIDHVASAVRVLKSAAPTASQPAPQPDYARADFLADARVALVSLAHAAEKHGIYQTDYERFAAAVEKFAATTTSQPDEARDAALEEAARLCDKSCVQPAIAKMIRALKSAPTAASPSHPDPETQLSELLRGLEAGPLLNSAAPHILFKLGQAIATQAKKAPDACSSHPVQQQEQGDGIEYEADEGTVAARRDGELLWHAHIYANDDSLNEEEVAKQVVAALAQKGK